jgi:hypothetical protein
MKVNEQQSKQLGNKTINVKKEEGKATAKKRSQKRKKKKKKGVIHFNQSLRSKRTGCAISHLLLLVAFPFQEKRRRKQSNAIIFFL